MNSQMSGRQKGLSLMELMVAMAIAFIIAAAMIALFVNSKQSYRMNENMSRLQENARFAVSFLARDIREADFRTCVTSDRRRDAVAGQDNNGLNGSDAITLLWQSNLCDTSVTVQTTAYSIQTGAGGGPALFRTVNGVATELVEGIEDLQITYGEDPDHDLVPNHYVDASDVADMADAISVRFTLISRTLEDSLPVTGGRLTKSFTSTVTLRNRLP